MKNCIKCCVKWRTLWSHDNAWQQNMCDAQEWIHIPCAIIDTFMICMSYQPCSGQNVKCNAEPLTITFLIIANTMNILSHLTRNHHILRWQSGCVAVPVGAVSVSNTSHKQQVLWWGVAVIVLHEKYWNISALTHWWARSSSKKSVIIILHKTQFIYSLLVALLLQSPEQNIKCWGHFA